MKKFLSILLAALVFFPAAVFAAGAPSANVEDWLPDIDDDTARELAGLSEFVPDFRVVAGDKVSFLESRKDRWGCTFYRYECPLSVAESENFAEVFAQFLNSSGYPFTLTANRTDDYTSVTGLMCYIWIFDYTGSRNVPRASLDRLHKYYGHVKISENRYYMEDRASFSITVADGIRYGGGN